MPGAGCQEFDPMEKERKRAPTGSLWGNFDESARVARQLGEEARKAREAKTNRLRALRLERDAKAPEYSKEHNETSGSFRV